MNMHRPYLYVCVCQLLIVQPFLFAVCVSEQTQSQWSVRMPSDSKTISGLHPRFRSHCRLSPEKQASPPWLLSLCLQFIMHCLLLKNNPWPSLHIDFYQPAGPMIDLPCKIIDFPRSPSQPLCPRLQMDCRHFSIVINGKRGPSLLLNDSTTSCPLQVLLFCL